MVILIVSALPLFGSLCSAAPTESESVPATTNVRTAQIPRAFPDGHAHFTLEAKSVQLAGAVSSSPLPMTKDADGVWSITTAPLVPGFHYYWFLVDGVQMNDPGSTTYMGYGKETSGIKIPESGVDFYNIKKFATAKYASIGIYRKSWVTGVAVSCTHPPVTTTAQSHATRCLYCNTVPEKTRPRRARKLKSVPFGDGVTLVTSV